MAKSRENNHRTSRQKLELCLRTADTTATKVSKRLPTCSLPATISDLRLEKEEMCKFVPYKQQRALEYQRHAFSAERRKNMREFSCEERNRAARPKSKDRKKMSY